MSVVFRKAPLIEIIAELRWAAPISFVMQNSSGRFTQHQPEQSSELLYNKFAGELAKEGFGMAERFVPPNVPLPPGAIALRFKETPKDEPTSSNLFQIGSGIFSANALPPYTSWHDFSPVVRKGVRALIRAGINTEAPIFNGLSLRYVNAFNASLIGDMRAHEFLVKILGFDMQPPEAISKRLLNANDFNPNLTFNFPVDDESLLTMTVAEGIVQNERAIVMDMNITYTQKPIAVEEDEIMSRFLRSREIIHDIFISITHKLHNQMAPSKP